MKIEPKEKHIKCLYPTVRIRTKKAGGSGTVVWSSEVDNGEYATYILTNHHVVDDVIKVSEEYQPMARRKLPTETRGTVEADFFKYRDGSRNIGTYSVRADIATYDKNQDLALIRLRDPNRAEHVAVLPPIERTREIQLLDDVHAVGAAHHHAPLMTDGHINFMDDEIEEYEYWLMSSPISFGNSGGSVYLANTFEFIGIPSRVEVAITGFTAAAVYHMGYFIPFWRIYDWLKEQYYHFIFDGSVTHRQCEEDRIKASEEQRRLVDAYEAQKTKESATLTNKYFDASGVIGNIDRMANK